MGTSAYTGKVTMKYKEITVRKAKRSTVKDQITGSYHMQEADISLTIEAEDGKLNEQEVIDRVKQLVVETMDDDPSWMKGGEDA